MEVRARVEVRAEVDGGGWMNVRTSVRLGVKGLTRLSTAQGARRVAPGPAASTLIVSSKSG